MYRVVMLGPRFFAYDVGDDLKDDLESIEQFVSEGSLVLLVDDLDLLINISGIEVIPSEIQIIKPDDDEGEDDL